MGTTPAQTVHTTQPSPSTDRDALIQAYAPHIKYIAQRLASRLPASICLDDLLSAGAIGLIDAIEKYDPTRGTTFKTYAEWRIRGAMLDELREWDWAPRSLRDKEHALTRAYAAIERREGRPATDAEVAAFLGLDLGTVDAWLADVRGVSIVSLDMPLDLGTNGHTGTGLAQLVEDAPDPSQRAETTDLKQHLAAAIDQLPEQEKIVLSLYYYEELTMQEIGAVLEVTLSRISQIRTKALVHLRAALQNRTHGAYATAA
jgi:RNA polymerase sigma factor for flagellar operon FliA